MISSQSEQRFAHLLEPIRDLAQNWSIDVAAELEDYISELESITISFEDGKALDFAEAALLIQGSACVYSKKVEHLYTLVYNTLDRVVDKKRKEQVELMRGEFDQSSRENCAALGESVFPRASLQRESPLRPPAQHLPRRPIGNDMVRVRVHTVPLHSHLQHPRP